MNKDNGGPAFPAQHSIDGNWVKEPLKEFRGMTLRDYFAIRADANDLAPFAYLGGSPTQRYAFADAMLKEREK